MRIGRNSYEAEKRNCGPLARAERRSDRIRPLPPHRHRRPRRRRARLAAAGVPPRRRGQAVARAPRGPASPPCADRIRAAPHPVPRRGPHSPALRRGRGPDTRHSRRTGGAGRRFRARVLHRGLRPHRRGLPALLPLDRAGDPPRPLGAQAPRPPDPTGPPPLPVPAPHRDRQRRPDDRPRAHRGPHSRGHPPTCWSPGARRGTRWARWSFPARPRATTASNRRASPTTPSAWPTCATAAASRWGCSPPRPTWRRAC